jgi:uncharacterized protein YaaR (DUF327 family)
MCQQQFEAEVMDQLQQMENEMTNSVNIKVLPNFKKLHEDYCNQIVANNKFGKKDINNNAAEKLFDQVDVISTTFLKLQGE